MEIGLASSAGVERVVDQITTACTHVFTALDAGVSGRRHIVARLVDEATSDLLFDGLCGFALQRDSGLW
jgi:hypothetical protein